MNLAGIQHLFNHDGPFVNVHVDVSRDNDAPGKTVEARWTTIKHELEDTPVDSDVLDAIGERVLEPTHVPGPARRSIVAHDAGVLFDDLRMGRGAWPEVSARGPLPDVSGWLAQVDGEFPFVLVVADREGADVDVFRSLSRLERDSDTVHGQSLHVSKVPAGDWSHAQDNTEEVWRRNARAIADNVTSAAKEHGARVVVLAGEVRARAEVRAVLESGGGPEVLEVEGGGRAAGSSTESLWEDVNVAVGQRWQRDRQEVLERLERESGQDGAVARGLRDTVQALVRGQVERLVVDLAAAHEQTVAPADYPGLVLPSSAFDGPRLHADQVLVAAGAATDADLTVLPAGGVGSDGVAALLRWQGGGS